MKVITASFDQGQVPVIACINRATVPLGVEWDALVAALNKYVQFEFGPVWGVHAVLQDAPDFVAGAWAIVFMDDADADNALGYHDLTPDGLPLAKVFVRTTVGAGELVSVTASHELAEMLVDPAINLCAANNDGVIYAYETADPVEENTFDVNGIPMSDFVYPAWFEGFRTEGHFDHLGLVPGPFQLLAGGYAIVFENGGWTQVFGSPRKKERFASEDRRKHRSERRGAHLLT